MSLGRSMVPVEAPSEGINLMDLQPAGQNQKIEYGVYQKLRCHKLAWLASLNFIKWENEMHTLCDREETDQTLVFLGQGEKTHSEGHVKSSAFGNRNQQAKQARFPDNLSK